MGALLAIWHRLHVGGDLMVMAQMVCLLYVLGFGSLIPSPIRPQSQWSDVNSPRIGSSLPWLALGPIIFLQIQVFQNIAGFAAVTGWTLPQAFLGIVVSNVVGLLVAALVVSKPSCGAWGPALLLGALLYWHPRHWKLTAKHRSRCLDRRSSLFVGFAHHRLLGLRDHGGSRRHGNWEAAGTGGHPGE